MNFVHSMCSVIAARARRSSGSASRARNKEQQALVSMNKSVKRWNTYVKYMRICCPRLKLVMSL